MKKYLIVLLLIGWIGVVWGQEQKETETLNSQNAITDDEILRKKIKQIIDENQNKQNPIGEIILRKKTLVYEDSIINTIKRQNKLHKKDALFLLEDMYLKRLAQEKSKQIESNPLVSNSSGKSVGFDLPMIEIDSVKFDIQEGMLEFIKVYLRDGTTYSNRKAPIPLIYLDNSGNNQLYDSDGKRFLLLKNVVIFDANKRFGYLPNNGSFTIKNQADQVGRRVLEKNGDINSLVSFTAYSDLLGLLGDEPNALVNFEASAKFYLHRWNLANRFIYLFSSIQPHFHYNRVDSKFDTIIVNDNFINPTEIFRRNNFSVGVDLSVFKWDWKPANSFEIKAGYLYTSSKVYIQDQMTKGINHIKYIETNLKSKVIDNFGIDLNARYMYQKLNDNDFFESAKSKIFALRGGLFYASDKAKGDDKIFLRFTNYLVLKNRKQDFSQIQLGFTKSLSL